jgi:hypothetical protein
VTRLRNGRLESSLLDASDGGPIVGIDYYVFNVASNAVQATFETFAADGNVDLYLSRTLCLTNFVSWNSALALYPYASTNLSTNNEFICVASNSAPVPLAAGDWYLAVVNREVTNSVIYSVRATEYSVPTVVCVTNDQANCKLLQAANATPGSGIDYYQVSISPGVVLALFETFGSSGNVDLYVSKDSSLTNFPALLPLPPDYPYASTNLGPTPECVTLGTNSVPVALTNGDWYVAVVNRDPVPVNYCFKATAYTQLPYVPLTNACGYTVAPTNSTGGIGVNYYSYTVSSNSLQLRFDLFGAGSGNVDLYLQKGFCFLNRDTFPTNAVNAAYSSVSPNSAEVICVNRDSQPIPVSPGEWFLAVVNRETNNVDYCLIATEVLDTDIQSVTNRVPYTPPAVPGLGINAFRYHASPQAVQVNFEILQPSGNVDLYVDAGFCAADLSEFPYVSANGGTTNELIRVSTNSTPRPLRAGDWLLVVANQDLAAVSYTIRVTEIVASQIIRLTNGVPYTNTVVEIGSVSDFPVQYYVYAVSPTAARAQFEILATTGDVNLLARYGALPGDARDSLSSANQGTSSELISVLDISAPVPLAPGDWFLAVENNTGVPVTYAVQAREFSKNGTDLDIGRAFLVGSQLCITWTNTLPGVNYYVVGKANFIAQAWLPVSGTLQTLTNYLTWCIQLPTPFGFFDLREGLSPLSLQNSVTFTNQVFATNAFTLCWGAPTNYVFGVYYSDSLSPIIWKPYPDRITSTNGAFKFIDDGSQTGGVNVNRFYRVIQLSP